jgi:putative oxidoreductase
MTRNRSIALWTLQILLALLFLLQAWMKLSGSPTWIARFQRWGYPEHFYLAVGLIELLGAVALVVPRLTRIGAGALTVVMFGAAATHLIHREPQVVTALVLIVLLSIIFYVRRAQKIPGNTAGTRSA